MSQEVSRGRQDGERLAARQELAEAKRTRRRIAAAVVLATVLATAWLAPWMLSCTPLVNWAIGQATSELDGRVSVGRVRLGWFSPVVIEDAVVADRTGRDVARVPRLATGKTLVRLLADRTDLGEISIESPQITLVLRDDGSNLEDVLGGLLAEPGEPAAAPPAMRLQIQQGQVAVCDVAGRRQWDVTQVNLSLELPPATGGPLAADLTSEIGGGTRHGTLVVRVDLSNTADRGKPPCYEGTAELESNNLPLEMLEPLLRRAVGEGQLRGQLRMQMRGQWRGDAGSGGPVVSLEGVLAADNLVLAVPALGSDRLKLEHVELPARVARRGNQLRIESLAAACDLGTLSGEATVEGCDRLLAGVPEAVATLAAATFELSGRVDVARLGQTLPGMLRLREGVQVASGQVRWEAAAENRAEGTLWRLECETTPLVALRQERRLTWEKPLKVSLVSHSGAEGFVFDHLSCDSDFLRLSGKGTPNAFELSAQYDLRRLAEQLGQFVDFGGVRLAGDGGTQIRWRRTSGGSFESDAQVQLNHFELAWPGLPPWLEQQLIVVASASGSTRGEGRVETAALSLTSGGDQMTATLTAPVERPEAASTWPVELSARGHLASWLPRVAPWVGWPAGWNLEGHGELTAAGVLSSQRIDVSRGQAIFRPLRAWGHGMYVNEPEARLDLTGRWHLAEGRLELPAARLTSQSLTVQVDAGRLGFADGGADAAGTLTFDGDMARMQSWWRDPVAAPSIQWAGRLQGQARVTRQREAISAELDATGHNLVAAPRGGQPWTERQVRFKGLARYRPQEDSLKLEQVELSSQTARVQVDAQVLKLSGARELDCRGRVDYDLEQLGRLVQSYLGPKVRLAGRESRSFWLSGPLAAAPGGGTADGFALERLSGEAEFGWQWANVYGLPIERGSVQGQLSGGMVRIKPVNLAVSGGRLRLAPEVRLSPGPWELFLPSGPLIERVRVTPEMCAQGLMYIAPVLAGVAQAQGEFSLELDGCRMPPSEPKKLDAGGRMIVHSIEIGPGPLVHELALLLGRSGTARLKRQSQVDFRVVEGRVYHRNLELEFPDVTIRTYGSVGFDQTLALVAEMPVPQKWLGNNPLGTALGKQTIQVPIGGTLAAPKLDQRVVEQLAAQFVRSTAESAIRGEVNRQLERLLGPLPPMTGPTTSAPTTTQPR